MKDKALDAPALDLDVLTCHAMSLRNNDDRPGEDPYVYYTYEDIETGKTWENQTHSYPPPKGSQPAGCTVYVADHCVMAEVPAFEGIQLNDTAEAISTAGADMLALIDRVRELEAKPEPMTPSDELASIDKQIKALEARRREIYKASLDAPPDGKVCDDFIARSLSKPSPFPQIEYPITVAAIAHEEAPTIQASYIKPGTWVAVRPCAEEYGGNTYLGLMVGDVALGASATWREGLGVLHIRPGMTNPCMWIPGVDKYVYGCGSFWKAIKSPEDLEKITDAKIDSVWYVRALKSLDAAVT